MTFAAEMIKLNSIPHLPPPASEDKMIVFTSEYFVAVVLVTIILSGILALLDEVKFTK